MLNWVEDDIVPIGNDDITCAELDTVPAGIFCPALSAKLAVVANDAVVIEPLNEPVFICADDDTVPVGNAAIIWVELLTVPAGTVAVAFSA